MRIGIVGAGNIGGGLARLFAKAGHEVHIANSRGPETLRDQFSDVEGVVPKKLNEVAIDADVVVISIPVIAVPQLPDDLLSRAKPGVVVIDTNNYYPVRDGHIGEIEQGKTESRWTADQIRRPVIKAFNNIAAKKLVSRGTASGDPDRYALPVAGDDDGQKQLVRDLIDQIGFDTVDAGTLDESWRQQPGSPVYGADGDTEVIEKLLGEASAERHPDWRAQ